MAIRMKMTMVRRGWQAALSVVAALAAEIVMVLVVGALADSGWGRWWGWQWQMAAEALFGGAGWAAVGCITEACRGPSQGHCGHVEEYSIFM